MRKARTKSATSPDCKQCRADARPLVWASLTLAAYLVTFILAIMLGAPGPMPFAYGGLAMLAILATEACLRGRLWMFEPAFAKAFGHPQVAHRLTYFSIGILLLLQTTIIIGFFLKS